MAMDEQVKHVVREYETFQEFLAESGLDYGDHFELWVTKTAEEIAVPLEADLLALCEDNEVMREVITAYFKKEPT